MTRDDYLAVNQGQLKTVAALFYDRLGQPYPWAGSSAVRDDYLLVNLGQLKHVFAFELNFRGPGSLTQIPAATLAAALAQWQALAEKPAGSSADDFDGDGIPNLQEYLMGKPLFDPLDIDGDRILDSVEAAHAGVLSKLRFADAVEDYDGDGVMNSEELLLGLNLNAATTSGRADGLGDSEVLAWSLAGGTPLVPSTDAVQALWNVMDVDWIDQQAGSYFLYWLDETLVNGVPAGLSAFRADVANWVWAPSNPSVWSIENPPLAYDQNWNPVDLDGNGVADFDRDGDNLPDLWEYRYTLNPRDGQDANSDPDGDQLPNWEEYQYGTNPRLADSDGDGFSDSVEVLQGGNPVVQSVMPPLTLLVVGSSSQAIYTGQTSPALAVKVTQGGLPVSGVSVAFQLTAGGGRLQPASSAVGVPGSSLSQTTASDGIAAVTYVSAAGEPEGTASISAGVAGAAAQAFTVSIVAIPTAYGDAGGSDSTVGATGGSNGNLTKVPTPPRSTAMDAASIAAASADGYRIRVKWKLDTQSSYPADAASLEYLAPIGLDTAAYVGWSSVFDTHSWAKHTRLEFEALPPPPPSKKPVVPSGARRYLVLVYQGAEVEPGTPAVPKYVGVLTFQYSSDTGARVITLTGGNLDKFISTDGSESVTIEPPLATKAEERVWISLVPMGFTLRDNGFLSDGWDNTISIPGKGNEPWVSVGVDKDNEIVETVLPDSLNNNQHPDNDFEIVVAPGSESYISINWGTERDVIPAYGGHTPFRIHGLKENKDKKADVILRIVGQQEALLTLHVLVLPLREIAADIMYISPPGKAMPTGTPTAAQIIDMLNQTFGPQASIHYTLGKVAVHTNVVGGGIFSAEGNLNHNGTIDSSASAIIQLGTGTGPDQDDFNSRTRIYIVPHIHDTRPGQKTAGFCPLASANSFWSADASQLALIHEVGHGLELATQMYDVIHDNGPWPPEMPNGKTGLMYPNIDNATKWIRKQDWIKANESAATPR